MRDSISFCSSCFRGMCQWIGSASKPDANPFVQQNEPDEIAFLNLGRRAQPHGLYSPEDVNEAAEHYGANCGPAAFAALTRTGVRDVMVLFDQFPERPWTTKAQMRKALAAARLEWQDCGIDLPQHGLALIEFTGPWSGPNAYPLAALARTHWVAVYADNFYDVNWDGWLPQDVWERLIFRSLKKRYRGAQGWKVRASFAVVKHPTALLKPQWA